MAITTKATTTKSKPATKSSRQDRRSSKTQRVSGDLFDTGQGIEHVASPSKATRKAPVALKAVGAGDNAGARASASMKVPTSAPAPSAKEAHTQQSRSAQNRAKRAPMAQAEAAPEAGDAATAETASAAENNQEKAVRDTFSFHPADYALIGVLREAYKDHRIFPTKGDVLRAGLHALMEMGDDNRLRILQSLPKLKTGRPAGK